MGLRTRGALAALPLVLGLALTGCGSSGGDDGKVASAGGGKGTGATASASADRGEMGVKFAQCMREHGIQMDDPEPGKGVQLKVEGKVPRETMNKATEACRQYDPMANSSAGSDPAAEEKSRKFSECMRKNGVEKFPDPKPGQRGIMIDKGTVGDDPDLEKAQRACQSIMAGGPGAEGGK